MHRRTFMSGIAATIVSIGALGAVAGAQTPTASPAASPVVIAAELSALLPDAGPDGLDVADFKDDTLDTVAAMLDGVTTRDEIAAIGYIEGRTVTFTSSTGQGPLVSLEVSVHAFTSPEGANGAVPFIATAFRNGGFQDAEAPVVVADDALTFSMQPAADGPTLVQYLFTDGVHLYQLLAIGEVDAANAVIVSTLTDLGFPAA